MNRRSVRTGAACLLLVPSLTTAVENEAPTAEPARRDYYVRVATGLGLTADSDLRIRQSGGAGPTNLTFFDVTWEDNSLSGPSARYTTVRAGYYFAGKPWMGIAVDFTHFKVFAEVARPVLVRGTNEGVPVDGVQPMNQIVERYVVGNGVNLIPVSFMARKRLRRSAEHPHGRVQPYVGFGAGPTALYTQSTVNGRRRGGPYELGSIGVQALGGVQFRVGRRWDLFFEYKRSFTQVNGSIRGGSSRSDLHTDHYTAGAGVHF